jgi:CheY-like chemotaxis protein
MSEGIPTIMLVDDDSTNNFICKRMLHIFNPNIKTIEFMDPVEALDYLNENGQKNVQLLLLDINMPKINGWQFLENLVASQPESDIILLTSSIDNKDKLKAEKNQRVKEFWTKPLSIQMLKEYFAKQA